MNIIIIIVFILVISLAESANSRNNAEDCKTAIYKNNQIGIRIIASRDTGPVTRMDGSGLIISVDIYTLEREKLPETLELPAASAVLDELYWDMNSSKDISISRYFDGTGFGFIYRQGPLWPLDSSIKVNIKLKIDGFTCEIRQHAIQIRKNS